jgi:hypothetical protein
MNIQKSKPKRTPSFDLRRGSLFVALLAMVGVLVPASFADKGISVSCFTHTGPGGYVGSAMVFDVSMAAQACNSMYATCKGECIGCFADLDYVNSICVDKVGNKFLK